MMHKLFFNPRKLIPGVLLFLVSQAAWAQVGLGVAPPRFELVLVPGKSTTENVAVFSKNTPDQQIAVSIVDWINRPDGSLIVLPEGTAKYSASGWISANLDPFALERDSAHSIRFSVTTPSDSALEGSYWAALAFTTQPKPVNRKGIVALMRMRALAIVYVTIQGTEKPAAALQGVSLVTAKEGGRKLVADVVNKGNVYLRLNGELRFVNAKGEVVKRAPLPERVLLRDGLVRYELPVPADLPEDVVLAAIEIQPQGPAKSYGGPPLYGEVDLK